MLQHNIKGILFDIDGTLYHQFPLRCIMGILLVSCNIFNPKSLLKKIKIILQYRKAQEVLRNLPDNEKLCFESQIAFASNKLNESPKLVKETVLEWMYSRPLKFIRYFRRRKAECVIKKLYNNNIRLGAYSDYPGVPKLKALSLLKYMSVVSCSTDKDIKSFKPEPKGFVITAQKMGLKPSEILYVGDREEIDGIGAKRAGMQVVIINSFEELLDFPLLQDMK